MTVGDVFVLRDHGAGVPPIQARAAELDQVWTNLITDALDAMDGRGPAAARGRAGRPRSS